MSVQGPSITTIINMKDTIKFEMMSNITTICLVTSICITGASPGSFFRERAVRTRAGEAYEWCETPQEVLRTSPEEALGAPLSPTFPRAVGARRRDAEEGLDRGHTAEPNPQQLYSISITWIE